MGKAISFFLCQYPSEDFFHPGVKPKREIQFSNHATSFRFWKTKFFRQCVVLCFGSRILPELPEVFVARIEVWGNRKGTKDGIEGFAVFLFLTIIQTYLLTLFSPQTTKPCSPPKPQKRKKRNVPDIEI